MPHAHGTLTFFVTAPIQVLHKGEIGQVSGSQTLSTG